MLRLLRLALISVIILFGIVTAISLLIPSNIRLTKVVAIPSEKDSIFYLIKNKQQWVRWHPSFTNGNNDPLLSKIETTVISETDSVLLMQWKQAGKKPLDMGWQLNHSNNIEPATLQWSIHFNNSWYPWEKFGSLFYENNYGAMMEQGLLNIKKEIEKIR
jgi:hypothetical protein